MKRNCEMLAAIAVAALVALFYWYARQAETGAASDGPNVEPAAVTRIAWSADGRKLMAIVRGNSRPAVITRMVVLQRPDGGQFEVDAVASRDADGSAAALSPDGSHVLVGTGRGLLWWLDVAGTDDRLLLELPPGPKGFESFRAVAIAADGARAAASTADGRIALCDLGEPPTASWVFSGQVVDQLYFSAVPAVLVGSGSDGSILVWDISDGDHMHLTHHIAPDERRVRVAMPLAGATNPLRILSVGFDDDVRLWDCGKCRQMWRGSFGCQGPMFLALSADGHLAAWGGMNHGKVVVWDLDRFEKQCEVLCPEIVYALEFTPDCHSLAVAGPGRFVRLYDVSTGSEQGRIEIEPPAPEFVRSSMR